METRVPGQVTEIAWLPASTRYRFKLSTPDGWHYRIGDASKGTDHQDAFDHEGLAVALADATGEKVDSDRLQPTRIDYRSADDLDFDFNDARWRWDGSALRQFSQEDQFGVRSPDGTKIAFNRDHDLWVRQVATGIETRLTRGGNQESFYGSVLPSPLRAAGLPGAGQPWKDTKVLWSPDSSRLLTHRIDTAGAGTITMSLSTPLSGSMRPQAVEYFYPLPGDDPLPTATLMLIDLASRESTEVDIAPLELYYYGSPIPSADSNSSNMWWRRDGSSLYLLRLFRGDRHASLYEINQDGSSRVIVDEQKDTPVDSNLSTAGPVNHRSVEDQDLTLWYSQRDGWGHLYTYRTSTGGQLNQLTSGDWAVADVLHVGDGYVYFTGAGKDVSEDPYLRRLYRVRLDGSSSEPELLTPQDGSHQVSFAPGGGYFISTWSKIDTAPVTELIRSSGESVGTIAEVDLSALTESGWRFPERFSAPARDGKTQIYGVIVRPSNFDPDTSYPVIDSIYGGPQMNQAPVALTDAARIWSAQAIAELGFVVVLIDGLGMPYRSKEFRDVSYRNLGDAGLPDHIGALRDLKTRYPNLDLDRVGIFGHSAGGYASTRAILAHPEFYKVCVSSAGNHDHRLDKAWWIERYQGWPVGDQYVEQANRTLAGQLQGKLLLIHGEADENVPVASTLSLADALIDADKDFDLLIMPNRSHACGSEPYVIRRRWDYFVRHLAGQEPPSFSIRKS
jgi:dipeptidyl-peptidase 4